MKVSTVFQYAPDI